jgi:hypothetical protein
MWLDDEGYQQRRSLLSCTHGSLQKLNASKEASSTDTRTKKKPSESIILYRVLPVCFVACLFMQKVGTETDDVIDANPASHASHQHSMAPAVADEMNVVDCHHIRNLPGRPIALSL